eukprot:m.38623 g.38623  ORF g.38623 m.38623 type:complete len:55 (+) comp10210_c0_seq2:109-273(+)
MISTSQGLESYFVVGTVSKIVRVVCICASTIVWLLLWCMHFQGTAHMQYSLFST